MNEIKWLETWSPWILQFEPIQPPKPTILQPYASISICLVQGILGVNTRRHSPGWAVTWSFMSSITLSTSCPAGKETSYCLRSVATTRRISVRASVFPTHCLWPVLKLAAAMMDTDLEICRTLDSPRYLPTPKGAKALLSMINSGRLVQRSGIKDAGSLKAVSTTHQVFISVNLPPCRKKNAWGIRTTHTSWCYTLGPPL